MTENKREVRVWFDVPEPSFPLMAYGSGVLLLFIGLFVSFKASVGIGLIFVAVGAGVLYLTHLGQTKDEARFRNRPSLDTMLQFFAADLGRVRDSSLSTSGFTSADVIHESAMFAWPTFRDDLSSEGKEGLLNPISLRRAVVDTPTPRYLYACWEVHLFHFGRGLLHSVSLQYDWYNDRIEHQRSESIGLDHLVSVRTAYEMQGGPGRIILAMSNQADVELSTEGAARAPFNEDALRQMVPTAAAAINMARQKWASRATMSFVALAQPTGYQYQTAPPPPPAPCVSAPAPPSAPCVSAPAPPTASRQDPTPPPPLVASPSARPSLSGRPLLVTVAVGLALIWILWGQYGQWRAKREVTELLDEWVRSVRMVDPARLSAMYADTVDVYFRKRDLPLSEVARLQEQFLSGNPTIMKYSIDNLDWEQVSSDRVAVSFDKEWDFRGAVLLEGAERERLTFKRISARWKIVGEEELQIYRVKRTRR